MSPKILITIEEVNNALDTLTKIYDSARIIRPLKKDIMNLSGGHVEETQHKCFNFWSTGKVCSNCIAMRALNDKDIFFKLEWLKDKVYMVVAVPVQENEETMILELIKDITDSIIIEYPEVSDENAILHTLYKMGQLQIKDSLTGAYNRRFIDEKLPSDLHNSRNSSKPLTVIFADIDRFKLVNDTYGHIAGDYILQEFVKILNKSIEGMNGWAARYGGEEFLICLNDKDHASVVDYTEKLRRNIEDSVFNFDGKDIKITSSFGVCTLNTNTNIQVRDLINLADKNLYAAKSGGRNKVIASQL